MSKGNSQRNIIGKSLERYLQGRDFVLGNLKSKRSLASLQTHCPCKDDGFVRFETRREHDMNEDDKYTEIARRDWEREIYRQCNEEDKEQECDTVLPDSDLDN